MADSQKTNVDANGPMSFGLELDTHADPHLVNFYEPEHAEGHVFRWSEPVAMIRLPMCQAGWRARFRRPSTKTKAAWVHWT